MEDLLLSKPFGPTMGAETKKKEDEIVEDTTQQP